MVDVTEAELLAKLLQAAQKFLTKDQINACIPPRSKETDPAEESTSTASTDEESDEWHETNEPDEPLESNPFDQLNENEVTQAVKLIKPLTIVKGILKRRRNNNYAPNDEEIKYAKANHVVELIKTLIEFKKSVET